MKVSILMIAYNHEKFIAQAIDSILMQKVDFDYEIVIGEDCSTDSTREIVINYQKRYPDKIRLLLPDKNLGMHRNFVQTFKACQGEYVALLEGDDYWIHPYKLQKQVDFLDSHPDFAICFHNALVFKEDRSQESWCFCPVTQKAVSRLEDLLIYNFIPTCSTLFRGGLFGEFPDWFYQLSMADWPLHIFNAQHGSIGYINEIMGAYRIHVQGAWSMQSNTWMLKEIIKMLETINIYLNLKYKKIIKENISRYYYDLAFSYERNCDLKNAKIYVLKAIIECPFNKNISGKQMLSILVRLYAPILYQIFRKSKKIFIDVIVE